MKNILWLLFVWCSGLSATTVTGNATLLNQSTHAGIKVRFTQASPTAVSDSALTDPAGNYSINLSGGLYQCSFSKQGYQTVYYNNNALLLVSSATVLANQILSPGVTIPVIGNVSGNWQGSNSYLVNGNIVVPLGQTLTIPAGTLVKFNGNYSLTVFGTLKALGASGNPVVFTSAFVSAPAADWKGIYVYNSADLFMDHCLIEKCETGVFLDHAMGLIENSEIRYFSSTGISLNFSSSTLRYNSIHDYTISPYARGMVAYTGHVTVECNSFFNGNGSGINCQSDGIYASNIIHHLTGFGISCSAFSTARITNNFIHHCDWGIRVGESVQTTVEPIIVNNTIWKNNSGIVLPAYYARPVIHNNLIAENNIGISQSNCGFCANTPSVVSYNNLYNNTGGNYSGLGIPALGQTVSLNSTGSAMDSYFNISADPQFLSGNEPHVNQNSPCRNAGLAVYNSLIGFDAARMCSDLATGISRYEKENPVLVFPNPFKEKIHLKFSDNQIYKITISNISGSIVYAQEKHAETGHYEISTESWPVGFYLLHLQSEQGFQNLKLLKEK